MASQNFIGAPEGPSHGNYTGVSCHGNDWVASLIVDDVNHVLGIFSDRHHAALVHDMEALRAFGKNAPRLNFRYQLLEENSSANNNHLTLLDSHGVTLDVDVSSDSHSSYTPVSIDHAATVHKPIDKNFVAVQSSGAPSLPDPTRSWEARNSSLYTPTASFVYEITFPSSKSLGLNLKPNSVYYSPESDDYIGTLVVVDCMTLLSSLVYPGDILLQINGTNTCDYGDKFSFDQMTSIITNAPLPRTVKFLRPSGPSHTLSPAEICLFMGLPADRSASNIPQLIQPQHHTSPRSMAKFNVAVSATGASQSLQLIYLESTVPLAMKRLMQGMKVNWEGNPAQKIPGKTTSTPTSTSTSTLAKTKTPQDDTDSNDSYGIYQYHTPEIFQETATTTTFTDGIIHKWIAQLVLSAGDREDSCSVSTKSLPTNSKENCDDNSSNVKQEVTSLDSSTSSTSGSDKGTSSGDVDGVASQKRKRTEPHDLEVAYRKKMLADKQYEKVYLLGKFDSEVDARAVLEIARKEARDNGGIFYPHKIIPPPRPVSVPSGSSSSSSSFAPHHPGSGSGSTSSALKTPLPHSSLPSPSASSSVPQKASTFTAADQQTSHSGTSPHAYAAASGAETTGAGASAGVPKSFTHRSGPPYRLPTKAKVKQKAALKAVAAAFQNNGPHSQASMNLGFSTTRHHHSSSSSSSSSSTSSVNTSVPPPVAPSVPPVLPAAPTFTTPALPSPSTSSS